MKVGIFVCVINPKYWRFPYLEAIRSYMDFADEVVVIDSGSTDGSLEEIKDLGVKVIHSDWPWEFTQKEYPIHYNLGFDSLSGDWNLKMDIDHILHENARDDFRKRVSETGAKMATFQRWNFLNRFQFYDKGRMPTAIKKGSKVKVGVPNGETNTDWTTPIHPQRYMDGVPYGSRLQVDEILNTGIPIYNYDCFFRPKELCKPWYQRIARANPSIYGDGDEEAWEHWKGIRLKQKNAALKTVEIKDHPKYIQEKLTNMTEDMWGHTNWSWNL